MNTEAHLFSNTYFIAGVHWIISALALKATASLIKGFEVKNFFSALLAAFVIGAANFYLKPFLVFLTFPITILTLGFFLLVIDGFILKLCAAFLPGFEIKGWFSAIFGAFVLALIGSILHFIAV